jgi:cyclomaltodextrinase
MTRTSPSWVPDAVFYQIFPDRFRRHRGPWPAAGSGATREICGGDLVGVREALPYLEDLGVNALYLTPIFAAASYHRYDTLDYYAVDPLLGGDKALSDLVVALRSRGMRIVLDGVFNHASDHHPFFADAVRRGPRSEYWNWFSIHGEAVSTVPEPNYDCWAGVPSMPEWNQRNPEVREYLLSVVRHWIQEFGIDGWRLDTTEYLPPDFVRAIDAAAKEVNPDAYVLGEVMGLGTPWFRHDALDGVMHYKLWERLVAFIAEETWDAVRLASSLHSIWHSYTESGNYNSMTLLGSHDKPRFLTLCGGDKRKLLLATAFLFTFPGAPAIYYGDEIGLEGGEDPDNRRCFPWDEAEWDHALLGRVRELVALRRRYSALRKGALVPASAEGRLIAFRRELGGERILVALNADSKKTASVPLGSGGPYVDAFSGEPLPPVVTLPPLEALVALGCAANQRQRSQRPAIGVVA